MRKKAAYIISRPVIFLIANIVCSFLSVTVVTWIANIFVPGTASGIKFKEALFEGGGVWSFIAWILCALIMIILFLDDGRRHSAYGEHDSIFSAIVLLITFAVYFIPVLFMDKTSGAARQGLNGFYFPCRWLSQGMEFTQEVSVIIASGSIFILCFAAYAVMRPIYLKKHPAADWRVKNPNAEYSSGGQDKQED